MGAELRTGQRIRALLRCAVVGGLAAASLTTACSRPGASLESAPAVDVWRVAVPLHEPVWSYGTGALIALTGDHRLAEVTAGDRGSDAKTRFSAPMASGRNMQISQKDQRMVFVPQPDRGKVAAVDLESLRQVDDFDAGPAPAYLAEDAGLRMLLALSADGMAVTPVDQYGYRKLPTATTDTSADTIDGANRGRELDYHLYGASSIRHFKGTTSPPAQHGSLTIDVAVSAGDGTAVTRSYVAGHDDDTVRAVDSRRGGRGMEVLASARLPAPIRALGTDDTRIYAATDHELVTLETASFTGFPDGRIPVLRTIDYRSGLPPDAQPARLSGMAVGPHRVYLTFVEAPYVVGIAKPRL
ncbi:hypothetical protein A5646_13770 [Mycobacterium sp. 1245499.0]|uniref:hypothetical protein n=1 Tax=unclassified Mycobacterium TaxID=2642494 RepID=UPI0007FBF1AC|nr:MULTISPECIES: hypothetical protein [unclassified Mycobacterium]OBJ25376.1 hypothetical protein A5622_10455 [Mycobacterium sp. 1245801.1]OBL07541.1 hypothetical protein A5646_13770 [Mycobacterium sp. 1245499.0]